MYVQENYSNEVGSCWLETYRLQRGALSKWARNHWTHSNCPPGCMQRVLTAESLTAVAECSAGRAYGSCRHRSARPAVQWDVCHTRELRPATASGFCLSLHVRAAYRHSCFTYLYMFRLISSKSNFTDTICIVSRVSFQTEILLEQNSSWAIQCFVYKKSNNLFFLLFLIDLCMRTQVLLERCKYIDN